MEQRNRQAMLKLLDKLPRKTFYVVSKGKIVNPDDFSLLASSDATFQICPRVLGGKGGFGSLLRSFRIYRSTNQDMCRDLTGRRVKDVKEEEKLKKWIAKKAERDAEKQRKKEEKYMRLKAGDPKHNFCDPDYSRVQQEILDKADDAIEQGLKAAMGDANGKQVGAVQEPEINNEPGCSSSGRSDRKRRASVEIEEIEASEKVPKLFVLTEYPTTESEKANFIDQTLEIETSKKTADSIGKEPSESIDRQESKAGNLSDKWKNETKEVHNFERIDLDAIASSEHLEKLGLDHLKFELQARGLKCGGNLSQRVERLWAVKGLNEEDIPKHLKAKKKKD